MELSTQQQQAPCFRYAASFGALDASSPPSILERRHNTAVPALSARRRTVSRSHSVLGLALFRSQYGDQCCATITVDRRRLLPTGTSLIPVASYRIARLLSRKARTGGCGHDPTPTVSTR